MRVVHSIHIDWLATLPEDQGDTMVDRLGVSFGTFLAAYQQRHVILASSQPNTARRHVDEIHVQARTNDGDYQPLYAFHANAIGAAGLAIIQREAEDWKAMSGVPRQPGIPDDPSELTDPPSGDPEA